MFSNQEISSNDEFNGKVLFVDDEESILKSIQRSFFLSDFEVLTAYGAKKGLEILDKEPIDIVISDFRMSNINGIEFFKIVKKDHPDVCRIILSGYVDQNVVLHSITSGITTTYITKPWEDKVLEKRINHILNVRKQLRRKELLEIVNSIEKLPTLPSLYQEFIEAIESNMSLKEIAGILHKDVSVATKVLQVANSAFYGLTNTTSIEQAATFIGLNSIKDIVFAIALSTNMKWTNKQMHYLEDIFFHSTLVNRYVPKFYNMRTDVDKFKQFPAVGLTHDIGKIILLQYYFDFYESVIELKKEKPSLTFFDCEQQVGILGTNHAELGAYFLDWWNLPEVIIEGALFHHTPEKSGDFYYKLIEVLSFTNKLINYITQFDGDKDELVYDEFHCDFLSGQRLEKFVSLIWEDIHERNNR